MTSLICRIIDSLDSPLCEPELYLNSCADSFYLCQESAIIGLPGTAPGKNNQKKNLVKFQASQELKVDLCSEVVHELIRQKFNTQEDINGYAGVIGSLSYMFNTFLYSAKEIYETKYIEREVLEDISVLPTPPLSLFADMEPIPVCADMILDCDNEDWIEDVDIDDVDWSFVTPHLSRFERVSSLSGNCANESASENSTR